MTATRVSFVVPVRDGERYLAACIDSILRQTVPAHEVIVVDDGSADASPVIAASFGAPVRCLRLAPSGQSAARNAGVAAATGDFIAFLDADDIAVVWRIERQLARFAARPELAFSDAWTRNFWSPEIAESERGADPRERFTHSDAPQPRLLQTWTFRRELFRRLGGFDEARRFGEDTEWRERVDDAGVVSESIEEVLALRRLHHGNLTRRHYGDHLSAMIRHIKQREAQVRGGRER